MWTGARTGLGLQMRTGGLKCGGGCCGPHPQFYPQLPSLDAFLPLCIGTPSGLGAELQWPTATFLCPRRLPGQWSPHSTLQSSPPFHARLLSGWSVSRSSVRRHGVSVCLFPFSWSFHCPVPLLTSLALFPCDSSERPPSPAPPIH